jgi:hypothetical protein
MLTSMTSFRNYLVFGKLFLTVASFLNDSQLLGGIGGPALTGISSALREFRKPRIANVNIYLLKSRSP